MNGLANAILTLLLSWLRIIINRFWALMNSETGTSFFTFLSKHWLTILGILLIGGFLLDRIIYLIRWRPFRVWFGRRQKAEPQELVQSYPAYEAPAYPQPKAGASYAQAEPAFSQPVPPEQPHWQPEATNYTPAAQQPQTAVYARPAVEVDRSAFMPPIDHVEPVFDEDTTAWADADALVVESAQTRTHAPVSPRYMQDVQAGFARPIPPEQLYAPPVAEARPLPTQEVFQPDPQPYLQPAEAQPVHPGLDTDVLRRNMGLAHSDGQAVEDWFETDPVYEETPRVAGFTPFTQKSTDDEAPKKNRNPFLNLMRLVGDEAAKPSIKDLQSNVDVRTAFHEPVFPQQSYEEEP